MAAIARLEASHNTRNASDDITDDELERRMRRKLLFDGPSRRANTFDDTERKIAAALLGTSESERLQNRRDNSRPFKPRKPLVWAEYYELPEGWRVDVHEDAIIQRSTSRLSREECLQIAADLSRDGIQVKAIKTEWMKHESERLEKLRQARPPRPKPESTRKAILDDLSTFTLRGC